MAGTADFFPVDDEGLTPEQELEAAARSALAVTGAPLPLPEPEPFGMTWAFDFRAGRFLRRGGAPVELVGQVGLKVWIEAAIRTARSAHPIYTEAFGMEDPEDIIGRVDLAETVGDYAARIEEALIVHDRIAAVNQFTARFDPTEGVLEINFVVVTDTGDRLPISGVEVPA